MLIQKPFYFWIQRLLHRSSNVILILLLLPFQKRVCVIASKFYKQTTPLNLSMSDFFLGDLVVFLLVLSLLFQAPKALGRNLFTTPVRWLVLYCITAFFQLLFQAIVFCNIFIFYNFR